MTKSTVKDTARSRASNAPRNPTAKRTDQNPLESLEHWLAARRRGTRILIAGMVAAIITASVALLLYNVLFRLSPEQLRFGPINPENILPVTLIFLMVVGLAMYWVGWRVLVGFDFSEEPLEPGRAAVIWVLFAMFILFVMLVLSFLALLEALSAP